MFDRLMAETAKACELAYLTDYTGISPRAKLASRLAMSIEHRYATRPRKPRVLATQLTYSDRQAVRVIRDFGETPPAQGPKQPEKNAPADRALWDREFERRVGALLAMFDVNQYSGVDMCAAADALTRAWDWRRTSITERANKLKAQEVATLRQTANFENDVPISTMGEIDRKLDRLRDSYSLFALAFAITKNVRDRVVNEQDIPWDAYRSLQEGRRQKLEYDRSVKAVELRRELLSMTETQYREWKRRSVFPGLNADGIDEDDGMGGTLAKVEDLKISRHQKRLINRAIERWHAKNPQQKREYMARIRRGAAPEKKPAAQASTETGKEVIE